MNEKDIDDLLHDDENDDNHDDGNGKECPYKTERDIPLFILMTLRDKSKAAAGNLKLAMDLYRLCDKEEEKKVLWALVKELVGHVKSTMSQYDYLMASVENGEDENGSEGSDQKIS